ncbi:hypothetical protein N9T35_00080 [bacterium]|nr:hypothetical protein [bacterium]
MANHIFVTVTKVTNARQFQWSLEVDTPPNKRLLPTAAATVVALVHDLCNGAVKYDSNSYFPSGNIRSYMHWRISDEGLARATAARLQHIPESWTCSGDMTDELAIDQLACDPIVSGLSELSFLQQESIENR